MKQYELIQKVCVEISTDLYRAVAEQFFRGFRLSHGGKRFSLHMLSNVPPHKEQLAIALSEELYTE